MQSPDGETACDLKERTNHEPRHDMMGDRRLQSHSGEAVALDWRPHDTTALNP